jgi:hypothetical protein
MEMMIKTVATLAVTEGIKGLINTSIGTYIKPRLENLYRNTELEKDFENIEYYIRDYLERSYKNAEIMNTIVFKNQQKKVDDLYIPLTLIKTNPMYKNEKEEIYIDKYKDKLINKYKKILLVDSAGMGKSTIIKYLYLNAIRENKGIPVLIELRKLEKDVAIIEFILNEINGIRRYFEKEHILQLIEGGDFIFFFDGYDEVIQESKKEVTENLQKFISKTSNNIFIISSRDENELNCFGDFQRFDIKSLTKNEAYKLIKKYDNNGELSKELIGKLETEENLKIIKEFLENPLMVSLLYKAFEYKKTIPYKKHIFYRQVYDALFEEHDLSKPGAYKRKKESNLDIEDFHCILRTIGFITLTKGVTYSKEEFIKIIYQARQKNIGINFNENKFILDITYSVPIFIKEGTEYRWAHKSFQEYFAACYISYDAKEKESLILKKMIEKDRIQKYYNILDFCYDINYKEFIRTIMYPIINDLEEFYKNKYNDDEYNVISQEDIYIRKAIEFKYEEVNIRKLSEKEKDILKEKDIYGIDIFGFFFEEFKQKKTTCLIIEDRIGVNFKSKNISYLISLLYNKGSDIVMHYNKYKKKTNVDDKFINIIEAGTYLVNDRNQNKLNAEKIFGMTNEFIIRNEKQRNNVCGLLFDYDRCMKLKNEIEKDIKDEEMDIDYL